MSSHEIQSVIRNSNASEYPFDLLLGIVDTRVQFKAQNQYQTVKIDPKHNDDECPD